MTELRALLVLGVACAGCATSSGREWLNAPLEPRTELQAKAVDVADVPPPSVDARPRLSHTVTLGESYASYPEPAVAGGYPPAVQVNVHTPIVINNYGGYGYGGYGYGGYGYGYGTQAGARGTVRAASARTTSGAPTKVGGDFPAVPDYGPRALR